MEIVTKIAPIALALIMLGLGLGLSTRDFLRVINNPKDFVIGFVCQLFPLPIVAYILILILNLPLEIALGIMIIAVDAVGGDFYPKNPVEGALLALAENHSLNIILVGPEQLIQKELKLHVYYLCLTKHKKYVRPMFLSLLK